MTMSLKLHKTAKGYAHDKLAALLDPEIKIEKPFVLLTGANGAGKSAILRGIRSTIGLTGERYGQEGDMLGIEGTRFEKSGKKETPFFGRTEPSAVFDLEALGWKGQQTYLFDSRSASQMASKSAFDDHDMMYHIGLIAGGGARVSHGQFVAKTWNEAIEWACGYDDNDERRKNAEREEIVRKITKNNPSQEKWLLIDEPEGAIDIERLLVGIAALLYIAEEGKLRVFCSSHSLLFATGLADHEKVQVIDLQEEGRASWLEVQKRAIAAAQKQEWVHAVGKDIATKITQSRDKQARPQEPSEENSKETSAVAIYKKLTRPQKMAMAKRGSFSTRGVSGQIIKALERRGVIKMEKLTPLGKEVQKIALNDKDNEEEL